MGLADLKYTGGKSYLQWIRLVEIYLYAVNNGSYNKTLLQQQPEKLTTTSTGIDVTGTATMDGL
jgi:hypothetical protein